MHPANQPAKHSAYKLCVHCTHLIEKVNAKQIVENRQFFRAAAAADDDAKSTHTYG